MSHEWTWEVAEWNTLPTRCEAIEQDGWEVFAILAEGETGRYLRIVSRREKKEDAHAGNQARTDARSEG